MYSLQNILKIIFFYILISCAINSLYAQTESENRNTEPKKNLVSGNDFFQLNGYFQVQGYAENSGPGNIKTQDHEDGIRIRRAILGADGKLLPSLSYGFHFIGTGEGINIEDAFAKFQPLQFLNIMLGRFTKPFGCEIYNESDTQLFSERSRYWSYLFNQRKSNGIELSIHTGGSNKFSWQNGLFYEYTNGFTSVRQQDIISRISYDSKNLLVGGSFNGSFKKFTGATQPAEYKGNLFAGIHEDKWQIQLEAISFFREFRVPPAGYGGHVDFSYFFDTHWQMGHRFSFEKLLNSKNLEIREIDFNLLITDKPAPVTIDYTLDISYYFFSQMNHEGNLSKISIEYNPSYHLSTRTLAHAIYLQLQVCF